MFLESDSEVFDNVSFSQVQRLEATPNIFVREVFVPIVYLKFANVGRAGRASDFDTNEASSPPGLGLTILP